MNRNQSAHKQHLLIKTKHVLLSVLTLLAVVTQTDLSARERIFRRYDQTNGLSVSNVVGLAQDAEGFIWIGTTGGLVRYDGIRMRSWAKDILNRDLPTLIANRRGEVLVAEGAGTLYRVTSRGVEPVQAPYDLTRVYSAAFDNLDRAWIVTESGSLYCRVTENNWTSVDVANTFPGENVRRIRAAAGNKVYVLTNKAVWIMQIGETAKKVADIPRALDVLDHPNGSVYVLAWIKDGDLFQVQPDGTISKKLSMPVRPVDLVMRGKVLWASFSHYLVALRNDEPPDIIGPEHNLPSGGPLLVDHEGSLWAGTFSGLLQYPEPETTIWSSKDGLSSSHTRTLEKTDEGIWVGIWGDLGRITREGKAWKVYDEKIASLPCTTQDGRLFIYPARQNYLFERRDGKFVRNGFFSSPAGIYDCEKTSDGTLLLATRLGIFRHYSDSKTVELLPSPVDQNGEPSAVLAILEDNEHRLWSATVDGQVCHAPLVSVLARQSRAWSCEILLNLPTTFDFVQLQSGSLWLSSNRSGIWRRTSDGWETIPASRNLPSQVVYHLTPSPSGGVWLGASGITMRVIERTDRPEGWEVVEVLSGWEGLAGSGSEDVLEEPGGDVWLTTSLGVVRVPVEARKAEAAPPRVKLVDLVVNGKNEDADKLQIDELPFGSQVELHFAALSYRDRGRLQYQYRLRNDSNWMNFQDNAPVLRFVDLGAGHYSVEMRASIDGVNWTATPPRLQFEILNPWYLRRLTLIIFALIIGAALYAAHRTRVGVLMRLERQRARIAMDLHDEMGSGLGSIGILSGLAAQENLEGIKRKDLAEKIAATAGELGTSLAEIVWALKPGSATLEGLAYHVAERAGRLFPSNEPSFTTSFPERWPKVQISLAVRRNLLLIASEALHNAARHSHATEVTFGIAPVSGKQWRLWVADNGVGVNDNSGAPHGSGIGLRSMRRRAEEISAVISWTANNGKGTTVSVEFDPAAEDRRLE